MTTLRPVSPPERVAILDVLRGLALFGVLIANVDGMFSGGWFDAAGPATHPADVAARWFVRLFVAGKAMTLLTFLFGLGFAVQLARAEERGEDVRATYARRLLVLLAIGLCHLTLLWWGDVTWNYAVVGFALLAFRRCRPRALLVWALALVLVPQLVMALPGVAPALASVLPRPEDPVAYRAEFVAAIRGTDYGTVICAHLRQVSYHLSMIAGWYVAWLLGRFLIGCYAGKRRLFDGDGAAHLPLFRRLLRWGGPLGVLASAAAWWVYRGPLSGYELLWPAQLVMAVVGEVAVLGMTVAYVGLAVLLVQRPAWRRALLVVAPVGRMPLTVYLGQSVLATFVFYGWGLGLAGRAGAAACLGISVAIFALQVAACHLWLRRYRFGPVEWLWRSLAYGRRPPMRA